MKKVLVTGANGHLGYNIVRILAENGYQVRASVRDVNDAERTKHLQLPGVEIVQADIMKPETLAAAMRGMEGLFHVAAVYSLTSKDPEKEVKEPIITGSENVLQAAKRFGIKKIIYTSSVAAVGTVAQGEAPLTEKQWNERAIEPYAQAKIESERRAWEFVRKHGLEMVAILPSSIIGPGFHRHTPTTLAFELLLRGQIPIAVPLTFSFVDVRDVAQAHILAYENPKASGRYIAADYTCSMSELFALIHEINPQIKIPTRVLSSSLLWIVPALDWVGNKLAGTPRFASRAMILEYGHRQQLVSSQRIRTELGWKPISFKQSVSDTVQWTKSRFIKK